MNIQQFAALKVGDKIDNAMSQSRGEVVTVDKTGVRVQWDGVGEGAGAVRHYSVQSTIWFHWSKDDDDVSQPGTPSETDTPTT